MEISKDIYFKSLLGEECDAKRKFKTGTCGKKECKGAGACQKIESALKEAQDARKFEIDLYWKRAVYFWGFESAIFAAYAVVFENSPKNMGEVGLLFLLPVLGLFITGMFHLIARGSKAWQENWEKHIDMLEGGITGKLHKMIFGSKDFFSPSRINLYTISAIGIFWCLLILFNLWLWIEKLISFNLLMWIENSILISIIISTPTSILIFFLIFISILIGSLWFLYRIFGNWLKSSHEKEENPISKKRLRSSIEKEETKKETLFMS